MMKKPNWIKSVMPQGENFFSLKKNLEMRSLSTVCIEAKCPNLGECWKDQTATIMILGNICTRNCKFCNTITGNPKGIIDYSEVDGVVEMAKILNLKYIVITSVTRDDLEDGGATHFARVVAELKNYNRELNIELLVPDFKGDRSALDIIGKSNPLVIAQNIEVVKGLTDKIRDRQASYRTTLDVLKYYKMSYSHILTKSSIMVGLGESYDDIISCLKDLRASFVDIVTIGQYLSPNRDAPKVERYYTPDEFRKLKESALLMGYKMVVSGPMVRSSYKAHKVVEC